jgi:hypothetical protein
MRRQPRPVSLAPKNVPLVTEPHVNAHCVVVKLHGNYRDTRIRNTPAELVTYSPKLNTFLDRVLDEFGLIICGWSGAYDVALRNAMWRCPTRRFATFWLAHGTRMDEAQRLIDHRRAQVVRIESANQFLVELQEKVEALRELEQPDPQSTQVAIATVKHPAPHQN